MTDREPQEPVQIGPGERQFVPTPPAPPEPPASPKRIPWKKIGERLAAVPKSIPWKKIGERLAAIPKSIPWMKIVEGLAAVPKSISGKKIVEGLAAVRSAVLNGLLLVSLVALVGFAVVELRRKVVVIDPIRMPETLREMGYSEDIAADRLGDEMAWINERTPTAKERVALQPTSQKFNFEPPGSGIALQDVVQMLRRLLKRTETRIVGEITCMTTKCQPEGLTLTLRVLREGEMKVISIPPIGDQTKEVEIDRYFRAAAIELLREIDPYVVAYYLYRTDEVDEAERAAQQLLNDPNHPDRKWALNLLGFIAADRREYDAAIGFYERAVKADKKDEFAIAYTNWGDALDANGEPAEAIKKFTLATERDPKNAVAYNSWGRVLGKTDDPDDLAEAIKKFTRATTLDPEYAGAYNNWGYALFIKRDVDGKRDLDGAIAKFTFATELDPNNAAAYANWGSALRAKGELAEAIEKSTLLDEAIEKFTLATKLNPEYADEIFNIAFALRELSKGGDPADNLRYAGDAVDAFQRLLVVPELKPNPGLAALARFEISEICAQFAQLRACATND